MDISCWWPQGHHNDEGPFGLPRGSHGIGLDRNETCTYVYVHDDLVENVALNCG